MKLNKSLLKAKWFDLDKKKDVSFKIRPFPATHSVVRRSPGSGEDLVEVYWKMFDWCLVDWKGIDGEDNKPLECNSENKRFLFNYSEEVMIFITNKSLEDNSKIIEKKT